MINKMKNTLIKIFCLVFTVLLMCFCPLLVKAEGILQSNNKLDNALSFDENKQFYLDGNELIKVEIEESKPVIRKSTYMLGQGKTEITKDKEVIIKSATKSITEDEKKLLNSKSTRDAFLTRSDEHMNTGRNIRAKLSVVYHDNADELFSDGYDLTLFSATTSYERIGAYEGITPQSSHLYYRASGRICTSFGEFVRNGILGFSRNLNVPTFTDYQLFPSGYSMESCAEAGVTYTMYCTRGVEIQIPMVFAEYSGPFN